MTGASILSRRGGTGTSFLGFRSWSLPILWRGLAHQRTPLLCQVMSLGKVAVGEWIGAVCRAESACLGRYLPGDFRREGQEAPGTARLLALIRSQRACRPTA